MGVMRNLILDLLNLKFVWRNDIPMAMLTKQFDT